MLIWKEDIRRQMCIALTTSRLIERMRSEQAGTSCMQWWERQAPSPGCTPLASCAAFWQEPRRYFYVASVWEICPVRSVRNDLKDETHRKEGNAVLVL